MLIIAGGAGVRALGERFEEVEAGGAVETEDESGAFFREGSEPIQAGAGGVSTKMALVPMLPRKRAGRPR